MRVALVMVVALLSVLAAACGDRDGADPGAVPGPETSRTQDGSTPVAQGLTMAQARNRVRHLTGQVLEAFGGAGLTPTHAYGRYTTCTDDGSAWSYDGNGRAEVVAGRPTDAAEILETALIGTDWAITSSDRRPSGRLTVRAEQAGYALKVDAYADQPFVLLQVFGPCMDASEEQRATYDGTAPEDIQLPEP